MLCAAVLDAYSRRIVGWSIDTRQDSALVYNALDMAIRNREPEPGGMVHADHGVQFTSWAFGDKIRSVGLMPSLGSVGDGLDNAMMESFWSSMQIELLNQKKWKTRVELANAIFEYIEIFYNRRRRHSSIVPLSLCFRGGRAQVELAVVQGQREAARAIFTRCKSSAERRSPPWPPMSAMGQPIRMSFLFTNSLAP